MRLTVHIGTTKTGTSSIQNFLEDNRRELSNLGKYVPMGLGHLVNYHTVLASLPFGESPDLADNIPISTLDEHMRFRARTKRVFAREVGVASDAGCDELIITAEQLQSRLTKIEHVQRFAELFASGFEEVRVVVYVRPQLDQAVSLYSTVLRTGYSHSLVRFIRTRMQPSLRSYFDLRDVISRWVDVVGRANVVVRPYKGIHGDFGVLGDFAELLGLDLSGGDWVIGDRVNHSISASGQELLRIINKSGNLAVADRRRVVAWAEENCRGEGAQPPEGLARKFQALFNESNEWVVKEYFPSHSEYLEPRWPTA